MWNKIKKLLFKNLNRLDCRVCHRQLDRPGGVGLPFVGCGFCDDCAAKIMKK